MSWKWGRLLSTLMNYGQTYDLNFTIRSLLQLLWALEKELINEFSILFEHEPHWNAFFQKLMHGGSHCLATLKVLEKYCITIKPLLRKLILQMYNCVKDRKNYHLNTCILMFPTCKRSAIRDSSCWPHPQGHRWKFWISFQKLREQDNYVLADLMKAFLMFFCIFFNNECIIISYF
jgi:hypothetical protein